MGKQTTFLLLALLVLSLIANVLLLVTIKKGNEARGLTGFSIKSEEARPLLENDVIEISAGELLKCCSFTNAKGEEDGCYVLKDYSCAYCNDYCV